jgi:hypothetical protein
VYYEEYGDAEAAHDRERQLKGWSPAKKKALVEKMNPKWRDIISEWENKYGLKFRLDGRITSKISQKQTQDPSTPVSAPQERKARSWEPRVSRAEESAREPSSAQDS